MRKKEFLHPGTKMKTQPEGEPSEFLLPFKLAKTPTSRSSSTINSSIHRRERENFRHIRRFKEEIIREKNQHRGGIRKNMARRESQYISPIETLEEIFTLQSFNSQESRNQLSMLSLEQSIIVMKGERQNLKNSIHGNIQQKLQILSSPFFRNSNPRSSLIPIKQIGFWCYYQVFDQARNIRSIKKFLQLSHPFILDIYSVGTLKNGLGIVLYEPFGLTLEEYLEKKNSVALVELLDIFICMLKSIQQIKNMEIYPYLSLDNFVINEGIAKMKLIPKMAHMKGNVYTLRQQTSQIGIRILNKFNLKEKCSHFPCLFSLMSLFSNSEISLEQLELQLHILEKKL